MFSLQAQLKIFLTNTHNENIKIELKIYHSRHCYIKTARVT